MNDVFDSLTPAMEQIKYIRTPHTSEGVASEWTFHDVEWTLSSELSIGNSHTLDLMCFIRW